MKDDAPVLLFDGDCGFCRRSVEKWRPKLEKRVQIRPYQEVLQHYPELSEDDCRESVKLIFGGEIYSGAHAVLKAFSLVDKNRGLLWSYEHIPFFDKVSESIYQFIANNRQLLSKWQRKK